MSFSKNWIAGLAALGPWAPFWMALADSSFLPLAQAVDLMVIARALTAPDQAYGTAGMAVAGSTLGCFAAYLAARRAGHRILDRFVTPERRRKLHDSFQKQGAWPLIVQTMVPLPLPMRLWIAGAGALGMQPFRFIGAVLFARTIRYVGLAFVTLTFGEHVVWALKERGWVLASLMLSAALVWLAWKLAWFNAATSSGRRALHAIRRRGARLARTAGV